MTQSKFNQPITKLFALVAICFACFGFSTNFGLDRFEIFLNNKLLLKQTVNQPLNLRVLQLEEAKPDDLLRINYIHCMNKSSGTDRNITLVDEKGNTLKTWTFTNSSGKDLSMTIPVKELLQLKRANPKNVFSLFYTARELPKGETLSKLKFG
ncbi:MAG: hypothetical protein ABWZ25_11345 [Chitinophagaceae bacterium]